MRRSSNRCNSALWLNQARRTLTPSANGWTEMDMVKGFSWVVRKEYGTRKRSFRDFGTSHSASDGITESVSDFLLTSTEQPRYQIYSLEESSQKGIANGVVTVISSVLPVLPILMLLWVRFLRGLA